MFALEHWDPAANTDPQRSEGVPLTWLNVGTGVDLTIRELAEQVAAATGYRGTITWDPSKADGTPRNSWM